VRAAYEFYHHNGNLHEINKANIVMIPKIENPQLVSDYQPISILNIVPMFLSEVLANRLRKELHKLVDSRQTTFVKGRQLSENFIATRELLHHISHTKNKAVFLKLDFSKAFDSVNWDFLLKVMCVRGFLIRWVNWIDKLLETSSSRVIVNGEYTDYFPHKRGLRQGDPLSSMFFIT
jgi:Reverse transcriptase (RNA-dependent DNA polymerase)